MKSRTSFFNPALFKKDITRFAPLWVLYTVGVLLTVITAVSINDYFGDMADTLNNTIGVHATMNLTYGILAAQLLFGELFNSRLCNALHAMPVTRQARFRSHLLAGLFFNFVPNLVGCLLLMGYMQQMWYIALLWWLAMTLQYLCFFGTAVFAMFCTGNRFAATLVYAIINFGSMVALWFAQVIFVPMMPGVVLGSDGFAEFSPVVKLGMSSNYFLLENDWNGVAQTRFVGFGADGVYLAICGAVGVVALIAAQLLYRRRALESAGDFMAVKVLKPIFLVLYTLCVGAFLAFFGSIFSDDIYQVFLVIGLVVGFFTGKMLLERTIRVFRPKSFLCLAFLMVLMWLALLAAQFDVLGIVRYVPEPDAVKKAEVVTYKQGKQEVKLYTAADLEVLQKAHTFALEGEDCKHSVHQEYEITYYMKHGGTVKRQYTICTQEESAQEFKKLFNSVNGILGITGSWEEYVKSVTGIRVEGLARQSFLKEEEWKDFLDCVYEDGSKGWVFASDFAVSDYGITISRGEESIYLWTREGAKTKQWLQEYEKKDMENYLQTVTEITLSEEKIGQEHYADLLAAIYKDCAEYTIYWNDEYENKDALYTIRIKTDGSTSVKVICVPEYAENTCEWIKAYLRES